eukprot:2298768-Rhodomonas_salina.1
MASLPCGQCAKRSYPGSGNFAKLHPIPSDSYSIRGVTVTVAHGRSESRAWATVPQSPSPR